MQEKKWWIRYIFMVTIRMPLEFSLTSLLTMCIKHAYSTLVLPSNLANLYRLYTERSRAHGNNCNRERQFVFFSLKHPDSMKWQLPGCHLSMPVIQTGNEFNFFMCFIRIYFLFLSFTVDLSSKVPLKFFDRVDFSRVHWRLSQIKDVRCLMLKMIINLNMMFSRVWNGHLDMFVLIKYDCCQLVNISLKNESNNILIKCLSGLNDVKMCHRICLFLLSYWKFWVSLRMKLFQGNIKISTKSEKRAKLSWEKKSHDILQFQNMFDKCRVSCHCLI